MILRNTICSDLQGIMELERECFEDPWDIEMMREEIENENSIFFVAEDKVLLAYAALRIIYDEGHIMSICVSKAQQGQGIATKLIKALIGRAAEKGIIDLTLEVRTHNIAAIKLYEKFGFETVGIRPKYYANGDDAFVMWRYGKVALI